MGEWLGRVIGIAVLIAVVAAASLIFVVRPVVPVGAAGTAIARATLTGPVSPDIPPGDNPEMPVPSPFGGECLPRIERAAGWADLCWQAQRTNDGDPTKDYYTIRVTGTFQSTSALGLRWLVAEVDLVGGTPNNYFDGWPEGTTEGPCKQVEVSTGITEPTFMDICGRTTGASVDATSGWRLEWTCSPCVPFDTFSRGLGLLDATSVPQGTVPSWDIFADLGG